MPNQLNSCNTLRLYDAHIHLDQYPVNEIDHLLSDWQTHGVRNVMAVATDVDSGRTLLRLRRQYPDQMQIALGYHPEQPLPSEHELDTIFFLIHRHREMLSGIGEVGLPHYRLLELEADALDQYKRILKRFAALARELDLPIILHAVHDKARMGLEILRETDVQKAHFHWLKAPLDVVRDIVAAGYDISVTPEVCYRERDRALVRAVPLDHLLVETDGPWPYAGCFAKERTTPLMLAPVIKEVAVIKNRPIWTVMEQLAHNYNRLFSG